MGNISNIGLAQQRERDAHAAALAEKDRLIKEQQSLRNMEGLRGRGFIGLEQNQFERQAGVTPPGYEGVRDRETGELLGQFRVDPFSGEASKRIREEALSTGPSVYARGLLEKQRFDESQARGKAGLQQQTAQSSAMSQLARMGGVGGGARTSLARSGARDALIAAQNVGAQGTLARFGINNEDMKRRQELLGTTADVERQGDLANKQTLTEEINRRATFDANRYNQQMQAWGAKQTADATRAAGRGGGKK